MINFLAQYNLFSEWCSGICCLKDIYYLEFNSCILTLIDNIERTLFFVFSPLCSGRLARIATTANGMAVAEHYAPFVRRFLPVLNDLSLTVKLEQQDHENNCVLRKCNCCSNNNHSRNLESYPQFRGQFCRSHNLGTRKTRNMLEPPQILLHSTSPDIQEEGKTIFISTWYFFIWDPKYF